jgi:hypothetical protein
MFQTETLLLPDDYYEYLSGSWLDGQIITYGGNGRGARYRCNYYTL